MSISVEKIKKSGHYHDIERMSDLIKSKDEVVAAAKLSIGEAIEINMNELAHYTDHTYNIYPDKVEEYKQSIEDFGLFTPLIVWDKKETKSGKYEILAGHHRYEACKALGWKKIPCILKKGITTAEANTIVNITNQLQRAFENLTIYEKAASIDQVKKAKEEIISKRPEILEREKERLDSSRSLGREFGISKSMISNYLILYNSFNKKWFEYFEDTETRKKIFDTNVGLILCKLPKKTLTELFKFIEGDAQVKKISMQQAKQLVDTFNSAKNLTDKDYNKILVYDVVNKKKSKPITIDREKLRNFFDDNVSNEEIMQKIIQLLVEKKGS